MWGHSCRNPRGLSNVYPGTLYNRGGQSAAQGPHMAHQDILSGPQNSKLIFYFPCVRMPDSQETVALSHQHANYASKQSMEEREATALRSSR